MKPMKPIEITKQDVLGYTQKRVYNVRFHTID